MIERPASDMRRERQSEMMSSWAEAGSVFSSILAGLVIGMLGDNFFGTDPWMVVAGVIAGFGIGFWRMYESSSEIVEQAMRRQRFDGGVHPDEGGS